MHANGTRGGFLVTAAVTALMLAACTPAQSGAPASVAGSASAAETASVAASVAAAAADVSGSWSGTWQQDAPAASGTLSMTLVQDGSTLSGTIVLDGSACMSAASPLSGLFTEHGITFSPTGADLKADFTGILQGSTLSGNMGVQCSAGDVTGTWTANR